MTEDNNYTLNKVFSTPSLQQSSDKTNDTIDDSSDEKSKNIDSEYK